MPDLTNRQKADALMARLRALQPRTYPQDKVSASEIVLRLSGDVGAFKPINAERVRVALSKHPTATAEFVINSRGGSVVEAEKIASLIIAHRGQTIATVPEECSSAACHSCLRPTSDSAHRRPAFYCTKSQWSRDEMSAGPRPGIARPSRHWRNSIASWSTFTLSGRAIHGRVREGNQD